MSKLQGFIEELGAWRRPVIWILQICVFAISAVTAFLFRFDFSVPSTYLKCLTVAVPTWVVVKVIAFRLFKLERGLWRYVSIFDVHRLVLGNLLGSVLGFIAIQLIGPAGFPRSLYALDLLLCGLLTLALRLTARIVQESNFSPWSSNDAGKNTLIYGAGDAGIGLLKEIRNNPRLAYRVVGFVDDNAAKHGLRVNGITVLGSGEQITSFADERKVKTILIAIPSAAGPEMTRILRLCHASGVECKMIPGLGELLENRGMLGQIREVAVEDLLGRNPVRLEEHRIRENIAGKVVMVTGAAGSIGSELCRQIARFNPAAIVGFDHAESPLFEIEQEMRKSFPAIPFHAEIGSIQNRARVDEVLCIHRPLVLYHAAAYKHVPLMEAHVFEAVENNIFGTFNVAEAAAEHGVEDMVMISSDKAVRPTNIMGTTKRIAEMLLLALQNGRTKYVAVRFGNVLGSNGSVIPIFKKQIAAGGPVTVTHPEMRRFFMTIPEACQLVLQAAAIGKGGQICVLDMGQPVKIVDLARNLILLSGLKPDVDIKIEFSGTRPGEKLYEELSSLLEDTIPTVHEKIRIFVGNGMEEDNIFSRMELLREICDTRDMGRLVLVMKEIVPEYNPSTVLLKRVIPQQAEAEAMVASVAD